MEKHGPQISFHPAYTNLISGVPSDVYQSDIVNVRISFLFFAGRSSPVFTLASKVIFYRFLCQKYKGENVVELFGSR